MKYNCIFPDFRKEKHTDINMETYYEKQNEFIDSMFPKNTVFVLHWLNSDSYESGNTCDIDSYIQCLDISDGVNVVEFENGNPGIISYRGCHTDSFEMIPLEKATREQLETVARELASSDMSIIFDDEIDIENELKKASDTDLIEYIRG